MASTTIQSPNKKIVSSELNSIINKHLELPLELKKFPSMQTKREKEFLYILAKEYFQNQGLIFDSGLYMGISTLCFGKGLQQNQNIDLSQIQIKPIQSFELGICSPGIAKKINEIYPEILEMRAGDSFLPLLRRNIRDVNSLTQLHEGDITASLPKLPDYKYEIVFLDVLKTASVNDCVLKKIFPNLIPGRSIVIQQDFITPSLPWIQISMGLLADYFEYLFSASASTVYLNTKPIPQELLSKRFYDDYTLDESLRLFNQSFPSDLNEVGHYKMGLAKGLLIAHKVGLNQGIEHMESLRGQYQELSKAKPWLSSVDQYIRYITRLNLEGKN